MQLLLSFAPSQDRLCAWQLRTPRWIENSKRQGTEPPREGRAVRAALSLLDSVALNNVPGDEIARPPGPKRLCRANLTQPHPSSRSVSWQS